MYLPSSKCLFEYELPCRFPLKVVEIITPEKLYNFQKKNRFKCIAEESTAISSLREYFSLMWPFFNTKVASLLKSALSSRKFQRNLSARCPVEMSVPCIVKRAENIMQYLHATTIFPSAINFFNHKKERIDLLSAKSKQNKHLALQV